MKPADCPPLKVKHTVRKCATCNNNMECGAWGKYYMECNSGFCTCSRNFADVDGNWNNGCEQIQYGTWMKPDECGTVIPEEELEKIQQVVSTVEFVMETTYPYTSDLDDSDNFLYTAMAVAIGNVFLDDLADMSDGWSLSNLNIEFSNGTNGNTRKRREANELVSLAQTTVTATYEKTLPFGKDLGTSTELLQRRVRYKSRKAVLASDGQWIKKQQIYQSLAFPEIVERDTTVNVLKALDYISITKPVLEYVPLPTKAPITTTTLTTATHKHDDNYYNDNKDPWDKNPQNGQGAPYVGQSGFQGDYYNDNKDPWDENPQNWQGSPNGGQGTFQGGQGPSYGQGPTNGQGPPNGGQGGSQGGQGPPNGGQGPPNGGQSSFQGGQGPPNGGQGGFQGGQGRSNGQGPPSGQGPPNGGQVGSQNQQANTSWYSSWWSNLVVD